MKRQLSFYNGVKDTRGDIVSLDAVLKRIKHGTRGLDGKTEVLRVLALTDKEVYDKEKKKLPAVAWSGHFRKRKASGLIAHSGLVGLDFDEIDVGGLMADLLLDSHVFFAFVSPSGMGVKAVAPVSPVPTSANEHKYAFEAVKAHFEQYSEIDKKGSDVSRLCFLAHDPQAIHHPNATPIEWDTPEAENGISTAFAPPTTPTFEGSVDTAALNFISADDYEIWYQVGMAIYRAGLPIEVWTRWSQTSEKYRPGDCETKWRSFEKPDTHDKTIGWGTVVHLAKQNGYRPTYQNRTEQIQAVRTGVLSPLALRRVPSKLRLIKPFSAIVDTLAKAREKIAEILKSPARVFGLRADTGVGKNYETESYVLNGGALLQTIPTSELAAELEDRMRQRGIKVFRYRGLMHHWKDGEDVHLRFPFDAPCIQASRCDSYRQKGGNFYNIICPSCSVQSECLQDGYQSQHKQAETAAAVLMPIPDAFTNPTYRGHLKPYLSPFMQSERLCIVDEADVFKLFVECQLTKTRLKAMMEMWAGHLVAEFAETLLYLLEVKGDPFKIGDVLAGLSENDLQAIQTRLRQVKVNVPSSFGGSEARVMSLDDAVKEGYLSALTESEITALPEVDGEWGLIGQLQDFFSHYRRADDAPIHYHNGVLRWVVPPVIHKKVWKLGLMSATLDGELLRRALPDAQMHDLPSVDWKSGAKVYQLRTHKNPRRTVYERDSEGNLIGFSKTGLRHWHLVKQEIRSTPEKRHAIITYKQVLEWITPEIKELDVEAVANFGGLVGLDTKFKNIDVLWVLFSPEIPPNEIQWRTKMLHGNDDEPLNFERGDEGVFLDARVQQVYNASVIAEIIQASGRARPVLHAVEIILMSAHHLPSITQRAVLFDEADWEVAGGVSNLASVVADREQAERNAAALTAENTIADFQEAYGCSYERARQLWHKAGGATHKKQADLLLTWCLVQMKVQMNIGERKIAKQIGLSYGKVRSLLKKALVH